VAQQAERVREGEVLMDAHKSEFMTVTMTTSFGVEDSFKHIWFCSYMPLSKSSSLVFLTFSDPIVGRFEGAECDKGEKYNTNV
jgi:hypothetical protein